MQMQLPIFPSITQMLSATWGVFEKHASYYSSDLYQSYTVFESGKVKADYYSKTTTVNKRKMKTLTALRKAA